MDLVSPRVNPIDLEDGRVVLEKDGSWLKVRDGGDNSLKHVDNDKGEANKGMQVNDVGSVKMKRKKCVKHKISLMRLVLGKDIKMHEVVGMDSHALVGRFHGKKVGELSLRV
jgi:hypothetical protein